MRVHVIFASLLTAGAVSTSTLALGQINPDRVETVAPIPSSTPDDSAGSKPHANSLRAPNADSARAEGQGRLVSGAKGGSDSRSSQTGAAPQAYGTFGLPFTSKRVAHGGNFLLQVTVNAGFLSKTYPYSAVGRLTFTDYSGSSRFCNASLIRRSVIVTSAHCVSAFGNPSLYRNFRFSPSYFRPSLLGLPSYPYGIWTVASLVRPASWANGTDIGSGAARDNDLAVMIVGRNLLGQTIGDINGWLGYGWNSPSFISSPKTGNLPVAAVTTVGYSGLLDFGGIMQRSDGPTYTTRVGGALQFWQGSNFTSGSSGSPWVVNFGASTPVYSGGASGGFQPAQAVVGVTSWGSADPNLSKDRYASRFGQNSRYPAPDYGGRGAGNIGALLTTLCNGSVPGIGGTWAQRGYCN